MGSKFLNQNFWNILVWIFWKKMTLKFMNLEGLERNFQPWKQTRKRVLLKLTLSVKTTHFTSKFTAFYHFLPFKFSRVVYDRRENGTVVMYDPL